MNGITGNHRLWRLHLFTLLFLALFPILTEAQDVLSPRQIKKIESTMADWVADPMEYGEKPKRTKYLTTISAVIAGEAKPISVHVVEFEMQDGTYGKGFVNPITWSFEELAYDEISNEQLVMAYSGWVWLFSALQNGRAITEFQPETESKFRSLLGTQGFGDVSITSKYRVADSEFFEFRAVKAGRPIIGAGSIQSNLTFDQDEPLAALPPVYMYLAKVMRNEL